MAALFEPPFSFKWSMAVGAKAHSCQTRNKPNCYMDNAQDIRCVNIDWLEVYCQEPVSEPRDADYFLRLGFNVKIRSYGTPNYRQMFTIIVDGQPFIEIRRDPMSLKRQGGVFEDGACHIRLVNRTCYFRNSVALLAEFILAHQFIYHSISRVDLCLDFQVFDSGILPEDFVLDFMKGNCQKINQCNLSAHGKDGWDLRVWNSLKWGSPTSSISTKLYNKSLELKQVGDKEYIRQCWECCGFSPDTDTWRVEFAIKPSSQYLVSDSEKELVCITLETLANKERQWFQFCVFSQKYFHFKKREYTRSGAIKPKNRCNDVLLFQFTGREIFFHPEKLVSSSLPGHTEKILAKRLYEMSLDKSLDYKIRAACEDVSLHLANRYIVLDYVRQLEQMLEYTASRHVDYTKDMALLMTIRDKYEFSSCRPKSLRKKSSYLIID